MLAVVRTRQAEEDLFEIWRYISADNPGAADRQLDLFDEKCCLLATSPLVGVACPELADSLRYLSVGNYVLFYRVDENLLIIVRVLHGSRDIRALFPSE